MQQTKTGNVVRDRGEIKKIKYKFKLKLPATKTSTEKYTRKKNTNFSKTLSLSQGEHPFLKDLCCFSFCHYYHFCFLTFSLVFFILSFIIRIFILNKQINDA